MILKPVCVRCQCFYRPEKNGFPFIEGMPNGTAFSNEEIRGIRYPDAWEPYKLWIGDLWKCPDCDHEIVVGVASRPVAEHYEERFSNAVTKLGATLQVNDC